MAEEPVAVTNTLASPLGPERVGQVREVGGRATWSLSSCKPGFGVEQLRDDSCDTYWQSDGQLPHLVNVQFRRKTTVSEVAIYTDYKLDESYTPTRISVRGGTNFNDLQEIEVDNISRIAKRHQPSFQVVDLNEPAGWIVIPLKDINERLVRTFMLQIAVLQNHQQGRDTHLRQVKVHSPVENCVVSAAELSNYTTVGLKQFQSIRCRLWCQDDSFTNEFMVNVLDLDTSNILLFR